MDVASFQGTLVLCWCFEVAGIRGVSLPLHLSLGEGGADLGVGLTTKRTLVQCSNCWTWIALSLHGGKPSKNHIVGAMHLYTLTYTLESTLTRELDPISQNLYWNICYLGLKPGYLKCATFMIR